MTSPLDYWYLWLHDTIHLIAKINTRSWLPWAFIWHGTSQQSLQSLSWSGSSLSSYLPTARHAVCACVGGVFAAQSCVTRGNPMECRPPSTSVHGTLQARRPEQVAISFSRASSQLRDWTPGSWIPGRIFYHLSQHFRSTQTVPKCRALSHQRLHTSRGSHISCLLSLISPPAVWAGDLGFELCWYHYMSPSLWRFTVL